ncbi:MAG TPA: hypothetical protein VK436_04835 [Methanocella sp.]|nr:hypothetical protein [Methanocella sp.]
MVTDDTSSDQRIKVSARNKLQGTVKDITIGIRLEIVKVQVVGNLI